MKKLCTLALILFSCHAFAQQKDSLKYYNGLRIKTTSNGMKVLGGWGLTNLGTGAIFGWSSAAHTVNFNVNGGSTTLASGSESKYFFQMNTIWGSVDFLTALLGYSGAQRLKNKTLSPQETLKLQDRMAKIFLVNGCLDIAYLGAGTYLKLTGDSRNDPKLKGYGESILMQGGFLFIFDALMYKAEKHNDSRLRNFLEKHPITFDGRRVGIIFNM
jgi:hypothetical protein